MGYGDDLLITAFAAKIKKKYPERQIVIGIAEKNIAYHSPIYDNNPNISDCRNLDDNKPVHVIDYHQFNRPYIDYKKNTSSKQSFKKFKPTPGEIYFTDKEKDNGKKIISQAVDFWKQKNNHSYKCIIFLETSSTKINDFQFNIKHLNKDLSKFKTNKVLDEQKIKLYIEQACGSKLTRFNDAYQRLKTSGDISPIGISVVIEALKL